MKKESAKHNGHHPAAHPSQDKLLRGIHQVSDQLSDRVSDFYGRIDQVENWIADRRERATDWWETARTRATDHPGKVLAAAFVAGVMTGIWMTSASEEDA